MACQETDMEDFLALLCELGSCDECFLEMP